MYTYEINSDFNVVRATFSGVFSFSLIKEYLETVLLHSDVEKNYIEVVDFKEVKEFHYSFDELKEFRPYFDIMLQKSPLPVIYILNIGLNAKIYKNFINTMKSFYPNIEQRYIVVYSEADAQDQILELLDARQ